ncbi:hypothetical protein HanIR_Chr14g0721611 [Helianthus annuus]|nr:hypothetical protein HanIR_Chr14g0721611 [Helianthus annuus]
MVNSDSRKSTKYKKHDLTRCRKGKIIGSRMVHVIAIRVKCNDMMNYMSANGYGYDYISYVC